VKKVLVLSLFISLALFSTGCQKKTLECSMQTTQSGMDMVSTAIVEFSGNNVTLLSMQVDTELTGIYVDYKDLFKSTLKSNFVQYESLEGVEVSTSDSGNIVTVKVVADIKKMDKASKTALDLIDTTASYNQVKSSFEQQGYICK